MAQICRLLTNDNAQVRGQLVRGCDLHVSSISTVTRQSLCQLLDPTDPLGKDWCLLAVQMGLSDKVTIINIIIIIINIITIIINIILIIIRCPSWTWRRGPIVRLPGCWTSGATTRPAP